MIEKEELRALLEDIESDRAERTVSTSNTDKFGEAICAFANDLPDNRMPGYLVIGADNDGRIIGTDVTDELLKNIAAIRTDGNIQPQPSMVVEKMSFPEGDIAVVEVQPSTFPPVKYKGRVWVRVGPRRAVANEDDEKKLLEKRRAKITKFDQMPFVGTTLDDIDVQLFKTSYLPKALSEEVLSKETRPVEYQLESLGFYDTRFNCPTYAGILFFGKNVARLMPSAYVQYVRFEGTTRAGEILMEHRFSGNLCTILPQLDTFIDTAIKKQRPLSVSAMREKPIFDYPYWATRELVMNAICHRDYETSGPIQFYQYDDRIEVLNHGWLYGRANEENFPNVNDYRNEVVAEGMRVLGFANRFSHGVQRVKNDLVANGNGEPEYDFSLKTAVLVKEFIAKHPEPYVPPIKASEGSGENDSTDIEKFLKELTERQIDIYTIIRSSVGVNVGVNVGVRTPKLAEKLKVNQRTIERDLSKLKDKGLIRYVGASKNGHWEPIK